MKEIVFREVIYLWYYFDIQLRQIFWYWVAGIVIGSAVSVFAKKQIHALCEFVGKKLPGIIGLVFASELGIASPLCMYGTIPICASFSQKGIRDDFLASFMMASVLLNPQLIVYSAALGKSLLVVRVVSCFVCGIVAGLLVRVFFYKRKSRCSKQNAHSESVSPSERNAHSESISFSRHTRYFDFSHFSEPTNRDTDSNIALRFLKNIWRNIKATGMYFLLGIVLSAVFQRYVPAEAMTRFFAGNKAWGILMAATVGVPLYVCGGGTIPLLREWLSLGMSFGSATAFMITGPATKITNLGALKIALGAKNFVLYILFVVLFSLVSGTVVNLIF